MNNYKEVFETAIEKGYTPLWHFKGVNLDEANGIMADIECSLIQKWLRDTHKIDIEINNQFTGANEGKWYFPTIYAETRKTLSTHQDCSYESALLQGIKSSLQLL